MANWTNELNEDDLNFIKRFVLASGSLKSVAREYDISYPTIRARIDRLIEKIKLFESAQHLTPLERTVRQKWIEGKIDTETMHSILAAHKLEIGGTGRCAEPARKWGGAGDEAAGVDVD